VDIFDGRRSGDDSLSPMTKISRPDRARTGPALPRPTLLPGLARLWRTRHTLQLGLDPDRAVVIEVADPATVRLLDLLDGTRSERAVLEHASRIAVAKDDARELIDILRDAGLVVGAQSLFPGELPEPARRRLAAEAAAIALRGQEAPASPAQVLRRRSAARVVVTGQGRLAAPVAVTLAQAGVGHVVPELTGEVSPVDVVGSWLTPADLHRPRAAAVADAITRGAPGTRTRPIARQLASLVVQVGMDRPAGLLAAGYAERRQAHLLVGLRDGTAVVGPLVPGPGAPCLNCLDLHRQDRDPGWPAIAAQLAAGGPPEPCAAPTLIAAAGYAAAEVLTFLDGGTPETVGGATEISAPGRLRRRAWPPHPDCPCGRRRRRRPRTATNAS
jgi:bacteriocin biosynthesis cyclodehydratase domain-containing protein